MCDIYESCKNCYKDCNYCEENNEIKNPTGNYYEFNHWEDNTEE